MESQTRGGALRFSIEGGEIVRELQIDDSISINGVCLTVVDVNDQTFQVEAVEETLRKSTLGGIKRDDTVNLELSLRFSDRMGGHLVQGHVDGVGEVTAVQPQRGGTLLSVKLPDRLMKYVISEGSIAIEGVSLTVARLKGNLVTISLIPHTLKKTTLSELQVGDRVNIEVDLIGKYVENLLSKPEESRLSEEWLQKMGYE